MSLLSERLGFAPNERVLIVTADDLGFSLSTNLAIYASLREGAATSASLMVPAPWAREAAFSYRGEDVGVHLTLNAELDVYRWGPITHAPSLLDGDGGFPRTVDDVWEHADLDEVRREWRAQVERAILWGFDVTHLDVHSAGVELKPEFFDAYLDLADEFRLPIRLPDHKQEARAGIPFRSLADERGVLAPDDVVSGSSEIAAVVADLSPSVTEIRLRPAFDAAELRAADPNWQVRIDDAASIGPEGALTTALVGDASTQIGYRTLRNLMRSES